MHFKICIVNCCRSKNRCSKPNTVIDYWQQIPQSGGDFLKNKQSFISNKINRFWKLTSWITLRSLSKYLWLFVIKPEREDIKIHTPASSRSAGGKCCRKERYIIKILKQTYHDCCHVRLGAF